MRRKRLKGIGAGDGLRICPKVVPLEVLLHHTVTGIRSRDEVSPRRYRTLRQGIKVRRRRLEPPRVKCKSVSIPLRRVQFADHKFLSIMDLDGPAGLHIRAGMYTMCKRLQLSALHYTNTPAPAASTAIPAHESSLPTAPFGGLDVSALCPPVWLSVGEAVSLADSASALESPVGEEFVSLKVSVEVTVLVALEDSAEEDSEDVGGVKPQASSTSKVKGMPKASQLSEVSSRASGQIVSHHCSRVEEEEAETYAASSLSRTSLLRSKCTPHAYPCCCIDMPDRRRSSPQSRHRKDSRSATPWLACAFFRQYPRYPVCSVRSSTHSTLRVAVLFFLILLRELLRHHNFRAQNEQRQRNLEQSHDEPKTSVVDNLKPMNVR